MGKPKIVFDPVLFQVEDNVDKDRYIIATYGYQGPATTNAIKHAFALAVEQSTGTWLPVPGETPELREKHIARVCGVYEVPNFAYEVPKDTKERTWVIRIAFPTANYSVQFAMLLTAVCGNISGGGKLKLLDLQFPDVWLKELKGPKFGVAGMRKLLNVPTRPLLNNMIKPCCGLSPEASAQIAYEVALGGTDIIKDDELIADASYSSIENRVKAIMEALKRADDIKGEKTLYTVNITDRADKLRDNAYRALDAGANALMINCWTVGLDACASVTQDPSINVPVLFHPDLTGSLYVSPTSGLSAELIQAKLPRLAGFDMGIVLSPYGKFPMIADKFQQICMTHLAPLHNIERSFPMPGGGTTQGHVQDTIEKLGSDVIIAAGGSIAGHPMGAAAGSKSFRQAIDVVMSGGSLKDAKGTYEELDVALDSWGLYEENKTGIFDLKG